MKKLLSAVAIVLAISGAAHGQTATFHDAAPTWSAAVFAAVVTAAAGFVGSWLGAQLALSSFKQQRAFDKRLDWYDRAEKSLQKMITKIDIALTFQGEPGTPEDHLKKIWRDVQGAQLKIEYRFAGWSLRFSDGC
jgi:hypothetical protein